MEKSKDFYFIGAQQEDKSKNRHVWLSQAENFLHCKEKLVSEEMQP